MIGQFLLELPANIGLAWQSFLEVAISYQSFLVASETVLAIILEVFLVKTKKHDFFKKPF